MWQNKYNLFDFSFKLKFCLWFFIRDLVFMCVLGEGVIQVLEMWIFPYSKFLSFSFGKDTSALPSQQILGTLYC